MHRRTLTRCLALTLMLCSGWAAAAPLYHVELVVFRHAAGDQEAPVAPDVDTPAGDALALDDDPNDAYRPLPQSDWQLGGVRRALAEHPNYEPLLHTAWVQPLKTPEAAPPVAVGANADGGLSGSVKVSSRRYLYLDAALRLPEGPEGASHRMDEQRRIRLGQLQYLDHPTFGVVLVVERVEAADGGE